MVIGAGLFAPHGGFGLEYKNAKNTLPIVILGTLSTGGTLKPGNADWGITGYNNDKKMIDGDYSKSGIIVTNISDPRNLNGFNPPMISKALVADRYADNRLEINFNNNYVWSYTK